MQWADYLCSPLVHIDVIPIVATHATFCVLTLNFEFVFLASFAIFFLFEVLGGYGVLFYFFMVHFVCRSLKF